MSVGSELGAAKAEGARTKRMKICASGQQGEGDEDKGPGRRTAGVGGGGGDRWRRGEGRKWIGWGERRGEDRWGGGDGRRRGGDGLGGGGGCPSALVMLH